MQLFYIFGLNVSLPSSSFLSLDEPSRPHPNRILLGCYEVIILAGLCAVLEEHTGWSSVVDSSWASSLWAGRTELCRSWTEWALRVQCDGPSGAAYTGPLYWDFLDSFCVFFSTQCHTHTFKRDLFPPNFFPRDHDVVDLTQSQML